MRTVTRPRRSRGLLGAQKCKRRSRELSFDEPDRAPELELNEIVWKSVRGPGSPMPPPVRSCFVQASEEADD
jgi:hypothetical protein